MYFNIYIYIYTSTCNSHPCPFSSHNRNHHSAVQHDTHLGVALSYHLAKAPDVSKPPPT